MSEPIPQLSDAQIERLLADLAQQSGSLTAEDLHRLEDLVRRVGGIEAAQELFETLEEIGLDGDLLEELDAEEIELEDADDEEDSDEEADDDGLDRIAA